MTSGNVPPPPMPVGGISPQMPLPQKTSGAAVTSMIMGLLICLPAITSLLAVILSIVGFKATGPGKKKGRGFAITGLILGILGVLLWSFAGVGATIVISASSVPRQLTRDFAREVSVANYTRAMTMCDSMTQTELEEINADLNRYGTFTDLTSFSINMRATPGSTTCELGGATYSGSVSRAFDALLVKDPAGAWKVVRFRVR